MGIGGFILLRMMLNDRDPDPGGDPPPWWFIALVAAIVLGAMAFVIYLGVTA